MSSAVFRIAIGSQRRHLSLATAAMTSHQMCEALVPVAIGLIIDHAVDHGSTGTLLEWLGVLLVLFIVLSYSYRYGARWLRRAVKGSEHELRMRMSTRILDQHGLSSASHTGELLNLATNDAQRVGMIHMAIAMSASAVGALVVAAVVLLRVSIPMGLLILLGMPPLLWLLHRLAAPLTARGSAEQEGIARSTAVATDVLRGLRVLKGIGAEPVAASRYRQASEQSLSATIRSVEFQAAYDGLNTAVNGLFVAAVALLGGWFAADGRISIGDLVAAVGLTSFLIGPFFRITRSAAVLALARGSAGRIAELLDTGHAVESGPGDVTGPAGGEITFDDVDAGPVHGLDLHVAAGEFLGLVVPDPAAAGAVLDRLSRRADPDRGTLRLDGQDVTQLQLRPVRTRLLVAGHDADLFEGTVRENVLAAAGPERLEPAVRASATDEVARSLGSGLDTQIAARGTSLSGGQRQRVALARALATDPVVLVLHDPTTAVDAATEARIATAVHAERSGRTTIVLTTSPAWLALADRVVVLGAGGSRTEGTHAQLVRAEAGYREAVLQ